MVGVDLAPSQQVTEDGDYAAMRQPRHHLRTSLDDVEVLIPMRHVPVRHMVSGG